MPVLSTLRSILPDTRAINSLYEGALENVGSSTTVAVNLLEKVLESSSFVKAQGTFVLVRFQGVPMFMPAALVQWLKQFVDDESDLALPMPARKQLPPPHEPTLLKEDYDDAAMTEAFGLDLAAGPATALQTGFVSGWAMHPHPAKLAQGETGEDALFVAAHGAALGIADGVGGWRGKGGCTDPGLYSKTLVYNCKQVADQQPHNLDPVSILSSAYGMIDSSVPGSSTATVVTLEGSLFRCASLGDSGVMVIRPGVGLLYKSVEQQHYFNCPYQLGASSSDRPAHACSVSFAVDHGDIVLLATDGVFDNVFDDELVDLVLQNAHADTPDIAAIVADRARELSATEGYSSPFAAKAQQAGLSYRAGGKLDDISVLVSIVDLKTKRSCNLL